MDIGTEMRVIEVEETTFDPERIEAVPAVEAAPDPADSFPKPI